jgi:hypothetical protein
MLDPAGHSTLVSRACHFVTWLLEADRFAVHNFVSEDSGTFPSILAAYLIAVADGNDRQSRSNFGDATLRGCLTAASAALSAHSRPNPALVSIRQLSPTSARRPRHPSFPQSFIKMQPGRFLSLGRNPLPWPWSTPFELGSGISQQNGHPSFASSSSPNMQSVTGFVWDFCRLSHPGIWPTNPGKTPGLRHACIPNSHDMQVHGPISRSLSSHRISHSAVFMRSKLIVNSAFLTRLLITSMSFSFAFDLTRARTISRFSNALCQEHRTIRLLVALFVVITSLKFLPTRSL